MKKVLALVLALVLVLSLGVVAFAGGNEQAEIITPVQPIEPEHHWRFPFVFESSGLTDTVVLEDNPDTGAPVVLPALTAVAVLAGAAYVVSKRK